MEDRISHMEKVIQQLALVLIHRGLPLSIGWPTDPPAKEPVGVAFTTVSKPWQGFKQP